MASRLSDGSPTPWYPAPDQARWLDQEESIDNVQ